MVWKPPSIHLPPPVQFRVVRLELIPAVRGKEVECTLNMLSVYCRAWISLNYIYNCGLFRDSCHVKYAVLVFSSWRWRERKYFFTYENQSEELWIIILKCTDTRQPCSHWPTGVCSVMSTSLFPSVPLAVTWKCWLGHYRTQCRHIDWGEPDSITHLNMKPRHINICQAEHQALKEGTGQHKHPPLISSLSPPSFFSPFFILLTQLQTSQVRLPLQQVSSACGHVFVQVIEGKDVRFAREACRNSSW